ncbi:MAG TPA: NB-ARC domain-containing protein [Candidatus Limnocylindrales bacterium]|nr:NB-ARC domain-containing protein [Candidatus Limnocylindrales bacterium]
MGHDFPSGNVTFLFTDVEGSTRLLLALGEHDYAAALHEHRRVLRAAFARHRGVEVDTQGDAFFVAFASADDAVAAASDALDGLAGGPIAVRMGIHNGSPLVTPDGYVGVDVHRAARVAAAAHGGQVLLTAATVGRLGSERPPLRDLGEHRLKDLAVPERIFQLGDETFPALNALSPSNLPVPPTPFLGREHDLASVTAMLADPTVRVLTLTGPGGIGKTRLALQAAAESSERFLDGIWWVALASLVDAAEVPAALARAVGVREEEGVDLWSALRTRLEGRRTLVLVDNAEHLLPEFASQAARLLEVSPGLRLLVTSRERLQVAGEHVFAVTPLGDDDAVVFVQACAAALGVPVPRSAAVETLCRRLDGLPLALQLAAARLSLFTPEQLLDRLGRRLDLLTGTRDVEARQRTLRATIEWSHDLLGEDERRLFRRLAVFVGGGTMEAIESVCESDAAVLQGLLDKSLVLRRDGGQEPRFVMLESIGEFGSERLDEAGERPALAARHAAYFRDWTQKVAASIAAGEPEEGPVAALEAEIDNLRAAVALGSAVGDAALVREITASLVMYWNVRGLTGEGRTWIERALALSGEEDATRRRLLSGLAEMAYMQGDHMTAVRASDEAAVLAMTLAGATEHYTVVKARARAAEMRGDLPAAERFYAEAFAAAREADNGVGMSACRLGLARVANAIGRHDQAEAILDENLRFVRSRGQTRCEAYTLASLAETSVHRRQPQAAEQPALGGARRAGQIGDPPLQTYCLDMVALAAVARGDGSRAAMLLAATEVAREAMGVEPDADEAAVRDQAMAPLSADRAALQIAWERGRAMDLEAAFQLASGAEGGEPEWHADGAAATAG